MNLTDLRPILAAYRQQAQAAWTPETAHAEFEGKAGDPAGQCGVTSAWLQRRLAEDHGVHAWFAEGTAYRLGDDELDHCWLEIGHGWQRVIVDITADQLDGMDRPVVCATYPELCAEYVSYIARRRLTAADLRADDAIRPRLAIFEQALTLAPLLTQAREGALRDAANAQRTLASEARTRDGKAEHEDIADWLDDRAAAISPSLEGAHP